MIARGVASAAAQALIAAPAAPGRNAKVGAPWGTKSAGWVVVTGVALQSMDVLYAPFGCSNSRQSTNLYCWNGNNGSARGDATVHPGGRARQLCRGGAAARRGALGGHAPDRGAGGPPRGEADGAQHAAHDADLGGHGLSREVSRDPRPGRRGGNGHRGRTGGAARAHPRQPAAELRLRAAGAAAAGFRGALSGDQPGHGFQRPAREPDRGGHRPVDPHHAPARARRRGAAHRQRTPAGGGLAGLPGAPRPAAAAGGPGAPRVPRLHRRRQPALELRGGRADRARGGAQPHQRQQRRGAGRGRGARHGHRLPARFHPRAVSWKRGACRRYSRSSRCRSSASTPCCPATARSRTGCGCCSISWPTGSEAGCAAASGAGSGSGRALCCALLRESPAIAPGTGSDWKPRG